LELPTTSKDAERNQQKRPLRGFDHALQLGRGYRRNIALSRIGGEDLDVLGNAAPHQPVLEARTLF